jgi:hypothetical protein
VAVCKVLQGAVKLPPSRGQRATSLVEFSPNNAENWFSTEPLNDPRHLLTNLGSIDRRDRANYRGDFPTMTASKNAAATSSAAATTREISSDLNSRKKFSWEISSDEGAGMENSQELIALRD